MSLITTITFGANLFRVGFINFTIAILFSIIPVGKAVSLDAIQASIMDDVRQIAYGKALVKFCPILNGKDYIAFTTDLIKAERLIGFQHGGAYKALKGQQEMNAWDETKKANDCNEDIALKIVKSQALLKEFANNSPLWLEMQEKHPKNPKPNQAFIFANYLQAKQAWIFERECHNLDDASREKLNKLMKQTQFDLEHFFRPDQLASLNKRRNERHIRALVKNCADYKAFTQYGIKVMEEDIPQAMLILKLVK